MGDGFDNVYADERRADAYAALAFPGTYHRAFRDLPGLFGAPPGRGTRALDFGCGAGRSTRFLRGLGFERVTGVDIAAEMLDRALRADPEGDYRRVDGEDPGASLPEGPFDVILSAFAFDNMPMDSKRQVVQALAERIAPSGRFFNLVSSPELYRREWASFSTRDFPENRHACDQSPVRVVMLDIGDRRPVEDILTTDATYQALFETAGLQIVRTHRPLGRPNDGVTWVSETTVAPWTIYELRKSRAE